MNERIKKLAEQAEEDTRIKHVNAYWRMQDELAEDATWREKFAELIVEDVVTSINDLYHQTPLEKAVVLLDAIRLIENRFYGVKE